MSDPQPELPQRFRVAPVARLATVRPDGRPHQVPVVFACGPDAIHLPIDAKTKSGRTLQRLRNITTHPAVSLLVDDYTADWSQLWWVRVDGTATITEDPGTVAVAHDLLRAKYVQYRNVDLHDQVIVVRPTRVATWTAG